MMMLQELVKGDHERLHLPQGWKFMSCSHCQEWGQQVATNWLHKSEQPIRCQSQQVDPTLDNDYNSEISASVGRTQPPRGGRRRGGPAALCRRTGRGGRGLRSLQVRGWSSLNRP